MSPSTEDGTTGDAGRRPGRAVGPAMEPAHGGRDDAVGGRTATSRTDSRNGARPRRTGRHVKFNANTKEAEQPQWSPSTEDGTTSSASTRGRSWAGRNGARPRRTGRLDALRCLAVGERAAMEPVHGGRDDSPGAQLKSRPAAGRNGARPRRTGRRGAPSTGGARHQDAAMEPVHGGRDDRLNASCVRYSRRPQWSPSTEDGTTS